MSLQIPDRLYGNSFSLVTNVSKIIGDVLFVSTKFIYFFFFFSPLILKKIFHLINRTLPTEPRNWQTESTPNSGENSASPEKSSTSESGPKVEAHLVPAHPHHHHQRPLPPPPPPPHPHPPVRQTMITSTRRQRQQARTTETEVATITIKRTKT